MAPPIAATSGWKKAARAASPKRVRSQLAARFLSVAAILALAGCGNRADLKPAEGKSLPVKPLMARATPDAEQLLTPPAYADPDRVDELMRRSTPREQDRFDLPPPSGQAPEIPVGSEEPEETNQVGPVTPE